MDLDDMEVSDNRRALLYRRNPGLRKLHELCVEWGKKKGGLAWEVMQRYYACLWGGDRRSWGEIAAELDVPEERVRAIWNESIRATAPVFRTSAEFHEARAIRAAYEQGQSVEELVSAGFDREVVEAKFFRLKSGGCQSC